MLLQLGQSVSTFHISNKTISVQNLKVEKFKMTNNSDRDVSSEIEAPGADKTETDFIKIAGLNLNSYATKKTLAQGILDLALLAANASQLKYILSAGTSHEFYHVILTLVIISICLQVFQACLCVILGLIFNLNKVEEQKAADIINNTSVAIVILIVVVNVIISAFDMKGSDSEDKSKNFCAPQ